MVGVKVPPCLHLGSSCAFFFPGLPDQERGLADMDLEGDQRQPLPPLLRLLHQFLHLLRQARPGLQEEVPQDDAQHRDGRLLRQEGLNTLRTTVNREAGLVENWHGGGGTTVFALGSGDNCTFLRAL